MLKDNMHNTIVLFSRTSRWLLDYGPKASNMHASSPKRISDTESTKSNPPYGSDPALESSCNALHKVSLLHVHPQNFESSLRFDRKLIP